MFENSFLNKGVISSKFSHNFSEELINTLRFFHFHSHSILLLNCVGVSLDVNKGRRKRKKKKEQFVLFHILLPFAQNPVSPSES